MNSFHLSKNTIINISELLIILCLFASLIDVVAACSALLTYIMIIQNLDIMSVNMGIVMPMLLILTIGASTEYKNQSLKYNYIDDSVLIVREDAKILLNSIFSIGSIIFYAIVTNLKTLTSERKGAKTDEELELAKCKYEKLAD